VFHRQFAKPISSMDVLELETSGHWAIYGNINGKNLNEINCDGEKAVIGKVVRL